MIPLLLSPQYYALRNAARRVGTTDVIKGAFMAALTLGFWLGIFWVAAQVLAYFYATDVVGEILVAKLMSILFVTVLFALIFSNIITSLSTYFLSDDLDLLIPSPTNWLELFYSRFWLTVFHASWRVLLFLFPVFEAYRHIFQPSFQYYMIVLFVFPAFLAICAAIGSMITLLLVNVFPARKTMDFLVLMSIIFFCGLYVLFRIVQPEKLVNPESFTSLKDFFLSIQVPTSIFLPNYWATESIIPVLIRRQGEPWFYVLVLVTTAAALVSIDSLLFERFYFRGWTKAQEARRARISTRRSLNQVLETLVAPFHIHIREFMIKDIKIFFRDASQWTQLLLLGALMVVYIFNIKALNLRQVPFGSFYLENLVSFLNVALAGFVLAAVSLRFVFPSISLEGRAMWIIKSSPLRMRRLVLSKFAIPVIPMLFLAELLIGVSNYILNVMPFIILLSAFSIFFLTLGIIAIGIGFGAIYPRFKEENVAKIASSYGGISYMVTCIIYIASVVLLEAWPTYMIFLARHSRWVLTKTQVWMSAGAYALAALVAVAGIVLPLYAGIRILDRMET